jgi:hypothetical protein
VQHLRSLALTIAAATALLGLTGCSGAAGSTPVTVTVTPSTAPSATPRPTPTPTPTLPANATAVAAGIKTTVLSVSKVVTITENNDPNNLIGRPTGYSAAAVLYDARTKCSDGLGTDCGAAVEQWSTAADAKSRAAYIEKLQKASPMLGTEYHSEEGPFLLRVSGALKPSQAKAYVAAFQAQF